MIKGKKMSLEINHESELCFDVNTQKLLNGGLSPAVFHQLVKDRNLKIIRLMIKNKADLNAKGSYGYTPLMVAALTGNIEGVKLLVEAGAGVDKSQKDGQTPLWLAALNGHSDIVSFLAKKGANLNVVDENEKQTPLMLAADFGYLDTVKALLKAGADVNFVSPYGQTALSYALIGRSRSLEVLKKIVNAGADIHTAPQSDNKRLYTLQPLVMAVLHRNEVGVKYLLSKGASGVDSALRFAKLKANETLEKILINKINLRNKKSFLERKGRERE